ncbi:sigma-70 family RNA polymerase sigma factor [Rhizohabitans arisaemae]|uniref:sigma-70 family RNA polymerase sigma factor n=1 Tax=Rhizohabitans arisaemae TaxID=2720610 RepID=UPI0024B24FC5|nr:sigma-70 family RNA polymerase sigma factor [Rhizohabitans arisaemae]
MREAEEDRHCFGQPEESLDELLRVVARGDEKAFERLYAQTSARVYGLVRRILRDCGQSEEVVQEIFMEVWRTAARFDPAKGSAVAWVMTVAHRRSVDRVRSEQAAHERERGAVALSPERPHDHVSENVEDRLEHERVRRCLASLTDLQRESITLAYYEGYTHQQVAQVLAIPLGTVKTRMRDGLIRLRDCLGVGA